MIFGIKRHARKCVSDKTSPKKNVNHSFQRFLNIILDKLSEKSFKTKHVEPSVFFSQKKVFSLGRFSPGKSLASKIATLSLACDEAFGCTFHFLRRIWRLKRMVFWKTCSSKWVHLPQISGVWTPKTYPKESQQWKSKYLSCHHLVLLP